MQKVSVKLKGRAHEYEIRIGSGLLRSLGKLVRQRLGPQPRQVVIISNRRVFGLYGETAIESLKDNGLNVTQLLIGDGERYKSFSTLARVLNFFSEIKLERNDAVVALGGGIVGDVAGFAAATYLRGVPYFQAPTTLLAQIDSSVGGKTGINLARGKNLVGAFQQPSGVMIDIATLNSLPGRELTSGCCEMVKNGAVGSRELFNQTLRALENRELAVPAQQWEALIASHCAFKAAIVAGDEREDLDRTDRKSRRILNFGHTVAHALEAATGYRRFRHGEAVGYGMLVAGEISKLLGLLKSSELELLQLAVRRCGTLPAFSDLSGHQILEAISRDKKSVAGRVQWVLLERIGQARIVSGEDIAPRLVQTAMLQVLHKNATAQLGE